MSVYKKAGMNSIGLSQVELTQFYGGNRFLVFWNTYAHVINIEFRIVRLKNKANAERQNNRRTKPIFSAFRLLSCKLYEEALLG